MDGNKRPICTQSYGFQSPREGTRQAISPKSPSGKLDPSTQGPRISANRTIRPGVPYTVVLYKTEGTKSNPDDARPSFGLSIRTVKSEWNTLHICVRVCAFTSISLLMYALHRSYPTLSFGGRRSDE